MYLLKTTSGSLVSTTAFLLTIGLTAACSSGSSNSQTTVDEQSGQNTVGVTENTVESGGLENSGNTSSPGDTGDTEATEGSNDISDTSNTENTDRPSASFDRFGQPITNPDNFTVSESNGIKLEMPVPDASMIDVDFVDIAQVSVFSPNITLRVTNNSANTISRAICRAVAFKNGEEVDSTSIFMASWAHIKPGDTVTDDGFWFDLSDLDDLDTARVSCEWSNRDDDIKDKDPLIVFELIEYSTNEFGRPVIVASLTNNSAQTIYSASCEFVIGKGNEVVAEADLTFNERDDIAPGESFMDTASFFTANLKFEDFDSDEFDLADLYCDYRTR